VFTSPLFFCIENHERNMQGGMKMRLYRPRPGASSSHRCSSTRCTRSARSAYTPTLFCHTTLMQPLHITRDRGTDGAVHSFCQISIAAGAALPHRLHARLTLKDILAGNPHTSL
jgi:hypothetical protein